MMNYPNTPGQKGGGYSQQMAEWLHKTGISDKLRDRTYMAIHDKGVAGATTEEVSRMMNIANSSIPARFRELELGGAIKRTGEMRVLPHKKRAMPVYVVTGQPYSPKGESHVDVTIKQLERAQKAMRQAAGSLAKMQNEHAKSKSKEMYGAANMVDDWIAGIKEESGQCTLF